jgi:thiol:disulfide interchange protein
MKQASILQSNPLRKAQDAFARNGIFAALVLLLAAAGVFAAAAGAQEKPAMHYTTKHIYSETADPKAEIAAALAQARKQHKRVLLDFGGDWCGDCQVLDIYFHQAPNDELLSKNYVLVHVWIGRLDHNLDIPEKYGVPIKKGVPALAVLDAKGSVLYSQKTGEFEDMRHMDTSAVTDFLEKWKRT